MYLSASKCDTFYNCKRLFKYRYIKQPFVPPKGKPLIIGSVTHKALELLHKSLGNTARDTWPTKMSAAFKQAVALNKDPLTRGDMLQIKSMLQSYLNEYRNLNDRPEHLMFEKRFRINTNGIIINGMIDRVDLDKSGSIKIIDYKTSKYPTKASEALDSVQLPTYALWARTSLPQCKDSTVSIFGEYIYLKHLDSTSGHQTFRLSDYIVEEAIEKYKNMNVELNDGCVFERNTRFKWCKYCEFGEYCEKDAD